MRYTEGKYKFEAIRVQSYFHPSKISVKYNYHRENTREVEIQREHRVETSLALCVLFVFLKNSVTSVITAALYYFFPSVSLRNFTSPSI